VDDSQPLPDLLVEPGAAPGSQKYRENVQRRDVGMSEIRNVPGEMNVTEFD
jgi:hypothetical protein